MVMQGMLKEVTILITLFTLFLAITRFLFMIGMKDITAYFPMGQERAGRELSSVILS